VAELAAKLADLRNVWGLLPEDVRDMFLAEQAERGKARDGSES
jgi:hypothetical protein